MVRFENYCQSGSIGIYVERLFEHLCDFEPKNPFARGHGHSDLLRNGRPHFRPSKHLYTMNQIIIYKRFGGGITSAILGSESKFSQFCTPKHLYTIKYIYKFVQV